MTATGCSKIGTTVTTVATASYSATCWKYSYTFTTSEESDDNDDDDDDDDDDDNDSNDTSDSISARCFRSRQIAARINTESVKDSKHYAGGVFARGSFSRMYMTGKKAITKVETCSLRSRVFQPQYPSASELESYGPESIYWYVQTMQTDDDDSCPYLTYTRYDNAAALQAGPVIQNLAGTGTGIYSIGGGVEPFVNVDHVCK